MFRFLRRLRRRRKPKHQHVWEYHPRTLSGWGPVVCRTCGKTDIY